MDSMIPELKKTYLFHDFTDQEMMSLARVTVRRTVGARGELGDPAELHRSIFFIHYGSIRMQALGPEEKAGVVVIQGTGTLIGDVSFLAEKRALFSAEAIEQSEVFEFPHDSLLAYLSEHPSAALKFYRALAKRTSSMFMNVLRTAIELKESQALASGRLIAF